jgi:hypothetical protein
MKPPAGRPENERRWLSTKPWPNKGCQSIWLLELKRRPKGANHNQVCGSICIGSTNLDDRSGSGGEEVSHPEAYRESICNLTTFNDCHKIEAIHHADSVSQFKKPAVKSICDIKIKFPATHHNMAT